MSDGYLKYYFLLVGETVNGFEIWYRHKQRRKNEWHNYYIRNESLSGRRTWNFAHNGKRFANGESIENLKREHLKVFNWAIKKITNFQEVFINR